MAGHAGAMPPPSNLQGPFKLIPPHFICSKQAFLNFAVTAVQLQCPVTEPCGFAAATSLCVLAELVNRAAEWEAQMIGSLALPSLGNRDQKSFATQPANCLGKRWHILRREVDNT